MKFKKNEIGSSVACSGVCLTVEKFQKRAVRFFISNETLKKTNFKFIKKNDIINLEKPLKFGERISGHFVQGHVDTITNVVNISPIGKSRLITFKLPKKFNKYLVPKGSITINGISLTLSKILPNVFQVSIIPTTLKSTNLTKLKKNDFVNLEFDILGKYIRNFIK